MARILDRLNDRSIRTAQGPAKFSDGGGLSLIVDASGAKRWQFRYRTGTREREAGLGSYPVVGLADARRRRDEARKMLADGLDPIDSKRKAKAAKAPVVTFGDFADELIPELVKGYANPKHRDQWSNSLRDHASSLRPKPIAEIETNDLLDVLRPIWMEKAETASRVRGRIERILDAARAKGLRTGENPARWRGHLDQLLAKRRKLTARGHHKAMPYAEMPVFVAALRERTAVSAQAMDFLILTAARTGEVIGAKWTEIDEANRLWIVPAERMKRDREHRVPLCDRAMAILVEMSKVRRGDYIFPSFTAAKPLSGGAFDALLDRMKAGVTTHGFRSSFRDWAGDETGHAREIIEAALSHAVGSETERAYRRGDALEKRRALMVEWSAYLEGGK